MKQILKNERLNIAFRFDNSVTSKVQTFIQLLDVFEESFLPAPTDLHITDKRSIGVQNFKNETIAKALEEAAGVTLETNEGKVLSIIYSLTSPMYFSIRVSEAIVKQEPIEKIKNFVLELIQMTQPSEVFVSFNEMDNLIYENHFEDTENEDVFLLNWLQYYDKKEFDRQDGKAIFNNPYMKAKQLGEGVLVQIGESPYGAYTTEGEELLVKASLEIPREWRR